MQYGQTSDLWSFLSGIFIEKKTKYFFNYYSQNITLERDLQPGMKNSMYDFYERADAKKDYYLNQSILVFMFNDSGVMVEEYQRVNEYGKSP